MVRSGNAETDDAVEALLRGKTELFEKNGDPRIHRGSAYTAEVPRVSFLAVRMVRVTRILSDTRTHVPLSFCIS